MNEVKVGTYEGTGAALNVELGWVPDYVRIVNVEDGDNTAEWFKGMTDGTSINVVTTAGPVLNAADGVSDYAGDSTHSPGFSVGTDHSESGKTYRFVAMRSGAGAFSA
jgi:hypothetical protein